MSVVDEIIKDNTQTVEDILDCHNIHALKFLLGQLKRRVEAEFTDNTEIEGVGTCDVESVIKPCPFCGVVPGIDHNAPDRQAVKYYISCQNGECPAEYVYVGKYATEEETIKVWNTRLQ